MRIIVMGTGPFAVPTFQWLLDSPHDVLALVTRPVPPAGKRRKDSPNPMRDLAESQGLGIYAPDSVNSAETILWLKNQQADLYIVCDYGQILSPEALATSRLGGINLHGSLLPKYRGAAPINWALYHGEQETGVTVILMTPRLDGGPCLVKVVTPIGDDETAAEIEPRLSASGVSAVQQAMEMLAEWDGRSEIGERQDPTEVTKAPRLKKADGQVDWTRSASQIKDQVRAFQPWPGTFCNWQRGKKTMRLILDKVSPIDEPCTQLPGTVVSADDSKLVVATGDGQLAIDSIQPSGKRVMHVDEFQRGYRIPSGDRLT